MNKSSLNCGGSNQIEYDGISIAYNNVYYYVVVVVVSSACSALSVVS